MIKAGREYIWKTEAAKIRVLSVSIGQQVTYVYVEGPDELIGEKFIRPLETFERMTYPASNLDDLIDLVEEVK